MVTVKEAAGLLEQVQTLLNSWLIPNNSRVPMDRFEDYAAQAHIPADQRELTRRLRDDLRAAIEDRASADSLLAPWIVRFDVRPAVLGDGTIGYRHTGGFAAERLAVVLDAVTAGTWLRLKACPGCRWVFYDQTRNGSKRWCLMNSGGSNGRVCGTIAKVRRYRERQR